MTLSPWESPPIREDGWHDFGPGGGSGSATVRGPFEFAFDTPGLADGVEFYTPTVGEVLVDCTFRVDTAWDGISNLADIGDFTSGTTGLWAYTTSFGFDLVSANPTSGVIALSGVSLNQQALTGLFIFTTTDPLLLVVSQDGTKGGPPSDASQGAARLYIVTALPVAF
jgi:hypothetical protein